MRLPPPTSVPATGLQRAELDALYPLETDEAMASPCSTLNWP